MREFELSTRWKPDTVPEIPIVGRVLTVGFINPEGGGTRPPPPSSLGFHALMLGSEGRKEGRKEGGKGLKQIRVTRVMKGWWKTLEGSRGLALMENICGGGVS